MLRAALIALVAIAALEFTFRTIIFPPWTSLSQQTFMRHPLFGHFTIPNLAVRRYSPPNYDVINHTNSLGFRDREEGFNADLDGIWISGGSNTFAGGVEDDAVYAAQLERYGYRAANLASEGHTIVQQAAVIRYLQAQGHRPRAVVLELTLNGVLADRRADLAAFDTPVASGETQAEAPAARATALLRQSVLGIENRLQIDFTSIKQRLIRHSAVYGWLKVGINASPALRDLSLRLGLRADIALSGYGSIELFEERTDNPTDPWIESTADFVARLRSWISMNLGAPFVAVIVPSHFEIYPDRFERLAQHHGLNPASASVDRPRLKLEAALRQRGIDTLDLLPVLHASGRNDLAFPDDAHMTAPAHALAARAIADHLAARAIMPDAR